MKKNYGMRDNLYNDLILLFEKDTTIEKVFLFGSRARGDYKNNSDIDLAFIFNNNCSDNYIKMLTKLEDINTLYKFDVVDYNKINDIKFKQEINKDKIILYEKNKS